MTRKPSYKIRMRREKVKRLVVQGSTEEQIADKLNVSRATIKRDKKQIRHELRELFSDDEQATERILELLDTQFKSILQEYWLDRDKHGSIRALGGIRHTVNDYIGNLQSLGFIKKTPEHHDLTVDKMDSKINDIIKLSQEIPNTDEEKEKVII